MTDTADCCAERNHAAADAFGTPGTTRPRTRRGVLWAAPDWCDGFRRWAVRAGECCLATARVAGDAHRRTAGFAAPGLASTRRRCRGVTFRGRSQSVAPL